MLHGSISFADLSMDFMKSEDEDMSGNPGSSQSETQSRPLLCVVCYVNKVNVILLPCAHVNICVQCSDIIITQANENATAPKCPYCKSVINQALPCYMTGYEGA